MSSITSLPMAATPSRWPVGDPYEAYSYSYPHKSAYGPLEPGLSLRSLWQGEKRSGLSLYFHLPFCEMRCGFCNLFARAGADNDLLDQYLDALELQTQVLADATATSRSFARLAVGGGTPTFLAPAQLERLLGFAERYLDVHPGRIPTSVETSPKTATSDRLGILRDHGVERMSIGVQSFDERETHAIGRPQETREVHAALGRLREFPILNIDLIYGQPGQTVQSWLFSLQNALAYRPEEIYLYPLYVRPNTGLGSHCHVRRADADFTRMLYREGRDFLFALGYEQISMRFFRASWEHCNSGAVYCCQTDGMLGLGCGARSYTSHVHYSSPFAVASARVQAILNDWMSQTRDDLACATWGVRLSEEDRRRRFVIQSLLTRSGLDEADYFEQFGEPVAELFAQLEALAADGLATKSAGVWRLSTLGLELSDAIGPSFYSSKSRQLLREFARP